MAGPPQSQGNPFLRNSNMNLLQPYNISRGRSHMFLHAIFLAGILPGIYVSGGNLARAQPTVDTWEAAVIPRCLGHLLHTTNCVAGRLLDRKELDARTVVSLGWTPHPVIVTIRDNRDYVRVLLYSYYTTITGWGVLQKYPGHLNCQRAASCRERRQKLP